jgi:DNA-directed RNA polymerase I subunit RPA43
MDLSQFDTELGSFGTPAPIAAAPAAEPKKRGRPPKDPNAPPKEKKTPAKKAAAAANGAVKATSTAKKPAKRKADADTTTGASAVVKKKKTRTETNGVITPELNGYVPHTDAPSHANSPTPGPSRDYDFTEESTRRIADYETHYSHHHPAGTNFAYPNQTSNTPWSQDATVESPFVQITASFKVTVPPIASLYPLEGCLAHYISPLLLTWHPQLDGILLAYNHAKLHTKAPENMLEVKEESQPMAEAIDECAAPYIWLTLECLVFQPKKGVEMEGHLTLQTDSSITLILWNFFTVSVSEDKLPKSWAWRENNQDEAYHENGEYNPGSWVDIHGNPVEGFLRFRIKDWDCAPAGDKGEGSFLSIDATMLTDEEEEQRQKEKEEEMRRKRDVAARRNAVPLPSALRNRGGSAPGRGSSVLGTPTTNGTAVKKGKPKKNA